MTSFGGGFSFGGGSPSFKLNTRRISTTSVNSPVNSKVNGVNQIKDMEVEHPPEDAISSLAFSPPSTQQGTFLVAGSWDNNVRCWQVEASTGKTIAKSMESMEGPVLDVCWMDDGTKVFMASADKTVKLWDLGSNQTMKVGEHAAPIKSCHWIKAPNYSCVMTSSWDKTIKFWDTRSPKPMMTLETPERCYSVDVDYPMAVVATAGQTIIIYQLEGTPRQFSQVESLVKSQTRCITIFRNKEMNSPEGYALGTVDGRAGVQWVKETPALSSKKNHFTFKCHRSKRSIVGNNKTDEILDIFAVNDLKFHPVNGKLATVGSDGKYCFWDKDARSKLHESEATDQSITCCAYNSDGQIFAYAVSYDWSKGSQFNSNGKKNAIFLHHTISTPRR